MTEIVLPIIFTHLTTKEYASFDAEGNELDEKHREFDIQRSKRLHWINHHVHEKTPANIDIFTVVEWDKKKRQDVKHTYIYDREGKYVIIFDRRAQKDFYLLTAYYLDAPYAEKALKKKMKKKEPEVI